MRILKPGETGWGGLIEWDAGYINPNQKENKLIIEQMAEAVKNPTPPFAPYPFYMYAVLQKAGIENKNGRIYPFDVLNPEVEKYQTLIPDRSTNEYNHPECHRGSAEILTKDGWKFIKNIDANEQVITLNSTNNKIELQTITKKIDQPYQGKMIKIFGKFVDLLVTPNHNFWVINKNTNQGKFITAQEIFNGDSELSNYYIPTDCLTISEINGLWLDKSVLTITEEEYNDNVYCVTVPNHIFYVRDQGHALWNGNSSIIDLERISHRIAKLWWEDKVLMGQLEIITTPAFRNHGQISCVGDHAALLLSYGITLGISSRGVGSLKNEHGKNIVQSDFELICFDLVSSPSTPGAYLFNDMMMKNKLPEMIKKQKDELIIESNRKLITQLNEFLV